ncbi:type VI secretion system protein ImpL [Erwinia sp. OLTSP20]|uniref:type VI secretion system membrane subunit TssM n=1 Tax=unclassified Erwinia TaxID=2622719 RepID=UPI000C19E421|nr:MULTISPECIES: type VI secretion system membrane subunit TssM [unclassified Erwinia]PIJ49976.1 type VI secretion system protein ImpL [Erwinia sp. OAMSP11]PIJ71376.1 type VI secretion system protein ImpL [Erwinia sp. OLSSP12]PIJ80611.1 type VI secretion system protein ImpL [Erwinia sp. OLCASP19]PIJ82793.1 type VI secretion system protein ImpL [Erwinia sp. OLMTSP26]PIJ85478.1 type VI secretion system protein ImpL [Erwinia sp. OLMDSP33]
MRLRRLTGHRLFWSLIGVVASAALIWLSGLLLPTGEPHWLRAPAHRLLAILFCIGFWLLWHLLPYFWRRWLNRRMLASLAHNGYDRTEQQASKALLDARFAQAIALLKNVTFSPDTRLAGRWSLQRLRAPYLYEIPWYIILGAPGAGKTTALTNAGLAFPLQTTLGRTALRGVAGTRHCDWWITDKAVLLDTAGRYSLHEGQQLRDASEWQTFIGLLKRYRTRQPINGVLMTISVADLLSESGEVRAAQANAMRQRLLELHQQTGIPYPVYLMISKTDLLRGFMSYFSRMDKAQRDQIWGFTFPWQPQNQQWDTLQTHFNAEFDGLISRLNAQLPARMAQEADLSQRAEISLFPQQFALLKPLLSDYLSVLFSHPHQAWSVRGLFFTSGTQEGLPFDRVMGELTRKLQLPQLHNQTIAAWDSVNRHAPIPATKGQSFFIHNMLTQVVFPEKGLAGSDRSWEQRNRLFHWMGYSGLGLALLLLSCFWGVSYLNNKYYLEHIAAQLPALKQQAQQLTKDNPGSILDVLPFLNHLVSLPQGDGLNPDAPPLRMRAGLYRGDQMSDAAWRLYQNALDTLLMPRVAQVITAALRDDKGSDGDFSRNALRAYQMLYQPRSYDGEFLRGWVMLNLQRSLPPSTTSRELQQLDWHLSQLLDRQIHASPYARDNALMMHKLALELNHADFSEDPAATHLTPHKHRAVPRHRTRT